MKFSKYNQTLQTQAFFGRSGNQNFWRLLIYMRHQLHGKLEVSMLLGLQKILRKVCIIEIILKKRPLNRAQGMCTKRIKEQEMK